ncbi:MAG: DHA2 family efflux MFS transporter permease subunit, partial [Micromonosporaceae bacterium]
MTPSKPTHEMTRSAPPVNPWLALTILCTANFLVLLDTTIVNTAAPTIMVSLDAGIDQFLWVLNGYLLAFAALLVNFGRLGDVLGPRTVFVAGLGLFTIASALCGLAQTPEQLIAYRVLQGVGAAALVPQALVLIAAVFPAQRRGPAFGVFTAVAGIAAVSGPILGGVLIAQAGWQSIFFLNLPVGVAALALAYRWLPERRLRRAPRFDLVGMLLAAAGLSGIVYGLIEGERHAWGTVAGPITIPGIFAAAVVLLVGFGLWERAQAEPAIPPRLFRHRNFSIAAAITFIVSFSLYGLLLVFVIQTQTLYGMSPLMSGVAALPWTLSLSALAPVAGRLADRIGGRILLVIGLACYALGVFGVGFLPTASSTWASFVLPLIIVGVGQGLVIAPATTEAMRLIPPHWAGAASGVLNTARQLGAALGVAVVGAVLQNRLAASLGAQSPVGA